MTNRIFRIGFTDSGLGSLIFAIDFVQAKKSRMVKLSQQFDCQFELMQLGDNANVPYSTKSQEQVNQLISSSLYQLERQGCKIGVVACNTACIDDAKFPFLTKLKPFTIVDESAKIAYQQVFLANRNEMPLSMMIMATEATIKSQEYQRKITALHQQKGAGNKLELYGFSAPELVMAMETQYLDRTKMALLASDVVDRMSKEIGAEKLSEISNIALFCTHYPLFKAELSQQLQTRFGKKFYLMSQGEILSDKILDEVEKDLHLSGRLSGHLSGRLFGQSSSQLLGKSIADEALPAKIFANFSDKKSQAILKHNIGLVYPDNKVIFEETEMSIWN